MSTHRDGLRGKGVPVGRRWARVREQHGRLLLAFYAADRDTFYAIKDDLRATFHRHRDGFWSPTRHAWSLPAHHRPLLQEWLASWFPPIPSPGLLAPPR